MCLKWQARVVLLVASTCSSLIILPSKTEHSMGLAPYFSQVSGCVWTPARCLPHQLPLQDAWGPQPQPWGGDTPQTQVKGMCVGGSCGPQKLAFTLCSLTVKNCTVASSCLLLSYDLSAVIWMEGKT